MQPWLTAGGLVVAFAVFITAQSGTFNDDIAIIEMPIRGLTLGLCLAGIVYLAGVVILLRPGSSHSLRSTVRIILVAGLIARLTLFASEPILENDYQRYLWDGGVTARGLNPYAVAPADVANLPPDQPLRRLAEKAGPITGAIGHPRFTTIYPPVAQGFFALAHALNPWSLTAWRAVILAADVATFVLLLALLRSASLPASWSAIYWWNPLVLKELFNSAHMDALVTPFVLLALLSSLKGRPVLATGSLALAAGTKIWPILLLPLIWRPLFGQWRRLAHCGLVLLAIGALCALPMILAGLGPKAGVTAFASTWRISAPLYGMIEIAVESALGALPAAGIVTASSMARVLVATLLGVLAMAISLRPTATAQDLLQRALLIVAAVLFLSPAVYPWYVVWLLPLLAIRPQIALLMLTALAPLYYLRFHFRARDTFFLFEHYVVWMIWVPVWIACAVSFIRTMRNVTSSALGNIRSNRPLR